MDSFITGLVAVAILVACITFALFVGVCVVCPAIEAVNESLDKRRQWLHDAGAPKASHLRASSAPFSAAATLVRPVPDCHEETSKQLLRTVTEPTKVK